MAKKLKAKQQHKLHNLLLAANQALEAKAFQACGLYCQKILELDPDNVFAWLLLAKAAFCSNDPERAMQFANKARLTGQHTPDVAHHLTLLYLQVEDCSPALPVVQNALKQAPNHYLLRKDLAQLLERSNAVKEALSCYRQLHAEHPEDIPLTLQYAQLLRQYAPYEVVIDVLRRTLALHPDSFELLTNLAAILGMVEENQEALDLLTRAEQIKPSRGLYSLLGWTQLHAGQREQAVVAYDKGIVLRNNMRSDAIISTDYHRLEHDYAQLKVLRERRCIDACYDDCIEAIETILTRRPENADKIAAVHLRHILSDRLQPYFERVIYREPGAIPESGVINPELDFTALEEAYLNADPSLVVVDHLLTPEARDRLYAFCVYSTIWKRNWSRGYLGCFLDTGFACPIMLELITRLPQLMPRVFQNHQLNQCWGFKYDSQMYGINLHADFAAVNLNFWITPDDANQNPDTGGLVVWDVPPPPEWGFRDYNRNAKKSRAFLEAAQAKPIRVPYRQNRALIFDSALFHETDQFDFKPGFAERRINITLLYGQGLRN